MLRWNELGWCKDGGGINQMRRMHDVRIEVIDIHKPDVVALVATWLKGEEQIAMERCRWFGRNGRSLHRKAVRCQV